MNATLFQFSANKWQNSTSNSSTNSDLVQLVLCFAGKDRITEIDLSKSLRSDFPNAEFVICSTAGEIFGQNVQDDSVICAALAFDHTKLRSSSIAIQDFPDSYSAAVQLIDNLDKEDLCYVMVFSDGSLVNGSELVKGLNYAAGNKILITGGLAGDGPNFKSTLLGLNEAPSEGKIIAIGFYGKKLLVTHGSQGGWDIFGLEKEITKSDANVLYEIDEENALELYKKYLGSEVENLPGASLLFPLSVTIPGIEKPVVRTILSIDETLKSMTFAGDVPIGSKVRFMKGNFDKLTAAAAVAAQKTVLNADSRPDFSLLISCVGRKLILGSRAEEEVEAVSEVFENRTPIAGLYAYGEISPFDEGGDCQLHNQTMTITSFYELP